MDLTILARRLPEEFIAAPGLPVQRALLLAHRHWPGSPEPELRKLANALLVTLEPLLKTSFDPIPWSVREQCERVVREWGEQMSAGEKEREASG